MRCAADGPFLAGAALLEKCRSGYRVRPAAELERLLHCAYGRRLGAGQIVSGLERAAAALSRGAMALAAGEAASVALPELANPIAALRLEVEDLLIAAESLRKALLRAGWDLAEHPRAGVPPNPGWFAPTGGPPLLQPAAASEEEERPEEALDRSPKQGSASGNPARRRCARSIPPIRSCSRCMAPIGHRPKPILMRFTAPFALPKFGALRTDWSKTEC